MNRAFLRILCFMLIITAILGFTLALSPYTGGSAQSPAGADGHAATRAAGTKAPTKTPLPPRPTPTSTPEPPSIPGSTDGIVAMSFVIVLIILLPIVLRWRLWLR